MKLVSTNIQARRKLDDLFMEGVEVRFGVDPETGKPGGWIGPFIKENGHPSICPEDHIQLFVRPPDPLQRDMSMREANAKRARALVKSKRDVDSEEHLTILAFLADMSEETLIDYVIQSEINVRRAEAEREVLSLEEWKDMEAYQDAMRQFDQMSPEELDGNEEWEAMLELDKKYVTQIEEREADLRESHREALRMQIASDRGAIERKALERRSEMVGTQAFLNEYQIQMLYYSVRQFEDKTKLFFEKATDVAAMPDVFQETLNEALLPFIAEAEEAKNSPRAESGSEQSEPPRKLETSESSIREEQDA